MNSTLKVMQKIFDIILNKNYFFNILILKAKELKYKRKYYKKKIKIDKNIIFYIVDKSSKNGLSDRLWGAVSTFIACKKNNLNFKIIWDYPFKLERYLVPNNYNWLWSDKMNYSKDINVIFLRNNHNQKLQERIVVRSIKNKGITHVRGVAHLYRDKFSYYYNILFKPSKLLQEEINFHLKQIGEYYISVTFRFQQLLGDFKEGNFKELKKDEQIYLIKECCDILEKIYLSEKKKILVTSDSKTYLESIKNLKYIYIIPGEISHMGYDDSYTIEDKYIKSFLDFYMIANADVVYSVRNKYMYKTTFAKTASRVFNKPYFEIEF